MHAIIACMILSIAHERLYSVYTSREKMNLVENLMPNFESQIF
jgi:hypothetical protein